MHCEPRECLEGSRFLLGAGRQGERILEEHGQLRRYERGVREA